MAANLDFFIGPRLAKYVTVHGNSITKNELDDVQRKHYGAIRYDGNTLKEWIAKIADASSCNAYSAVRLPIPRQLTFWVENKRAASLHVHVPA
jgi:hypothetical protein